MAGRRQPLATLPHGANSPYRGGAAAAIKRARTQAIDSKERLPGEPPAKKQAVEGHGMIRRAFSQPSQVVEDRVPFKRPTNTQPTALERKFIAARETKQTQPRSAEKTYKATNEKDLETIRQWQRHYRKAFPAFVFYFESVPDDVRLKSVKQILSLGGREEKFFSKSVTHVITTRAVPSESKPVRASFEQETTSIVTKSQSTIEQSRTNNASTLDGPLDTKAKLQLETAVHRKVVGGAAGDVLYKARDLAIKIWAVEKFQRMLNTLLNAAITEQEQHGAGIPTNSTHVKDADLSRLLQNEKKLNNAPVSAIEIVPFKGYYIYIHDMDEQTRPVMVREYGKTPKEQGSWPQFHSVAAGKCPFVEDAAYSRRIKPPLEKEANPTIEQREILAPRTRATTAMYAARARESVEPDAKVLEEIDANARRNLKPAAGIQAQPLDPPKVVPVKRPCPDSMPPLLHSAQPNFRGFRQFHGGEPMASGVQPSNVTSAIQSQMISSTAAAAPGARAGTSKEVHQLQRKVLERNSRPPSANGVPSLNDIRAAINGDRSIPSTRSSKRKMQERLVNIREEEEEETLSEEEENSGRQLRAPKKVARTKRVEEKELKPGYCENCREKYKDFDEHSESRKHKKFAQAPEHWVELDKLLARLQRPEKIVL